MNDKNSPLLRLNDVANILTKFHKDWMKTKTSIVYTSDIINILTKFHKDWMKTVTSIVYTSNLINILTKFHKDWMKTVTSTVYTNKLLTTHAHTHLQRTPDITRSHKLTMSLCDRKRLEGTAQNIIGTNILTKFHEDWTINVTSRVLTRKTATPPSSFCHEDWTINVASRVLTRFYYSHIRKNAPLLESHGFQANDIIETNLLTKFHEDLTINVASMVLTRPYNENAPPLVVMYIIGTNYMTKFHDDRKINVTSRVLTRRNAPPPTINVASRVKNAPPPLAAKFFQANVTIFDLIQDINNTNLLNIFPEDWTINVAPRVLTKKNAPPPGNIIGTNILTKFHEDRNINMASRVLTRIYYSHNRKNAPPLGGHVFQQAGIVFELVQDIVEMNLLTKKNAPPLGSHVLENKKNVASRALTRKNAPPPGGHVFQPTGIIFQLFQDIIGVNLVTKFHEDWTINVASRVLTRFYNSHKKPYKEKCPAPWQSCFSSKYIIGKNLLTKCHEDWKINVASRPRPRGGHVFQSTSIIFDLVHDIIGMNLLTKFHEGQTINVASRVHIMKNAPPLGSHVLQANKINVASTEFARQMLTAHDGRRTKGDHKSSP
ncbi:hypothetical protein DPMN_127178 [Dreissena polymorpha]|uniref:Uncharacterized protein n=1 Tax=Dreissena polymorpha TaxID=45954 RepID=A0A9D4JWA2_DREPO|nr:hypothetical protein DPMN_127178 [Dreissena polymorpha]